MNHIKLPSFCIVALAAVVLLSLAHRSQGAPARPPSSAMAAPLLDSTMQNAEISAVRDLVEEKKEIKRRIIKQLRVQLRKMKKAGAEA